MCMHDLQLEKMAARAELGARLASYAEKASKARAAKQAGRRLAAASMAAALAGPLQTRAQSRASAEAASACATEGQVPVVLNSRLNGLAYPLHLGTLAAGQPADDILRDPCTCRRMLSGLPGFRKLGVWCLGVQMKTYFSHLAKDRLR